MGYGGGPRRAETGYALAAPRRMPNGLTPPNTLHPTPYTLHPTPYTRHPTPYTLHHTPYTIHPTPYTLHLTPYTLHPAPYALHPTPFTIHPTPTLSDRLRVGWFNGFLPLWEGYRESRSFSGDTYPVSYITQEYLYAKTKWEHTRFWSWLSGKIP